MAYFWSAVQIVFSVVIALAVVYAIFRILIYLRVEGQSGLRVTVALGAAGLGLDIIGSSLFAVAFFLGFYIFAGFKSSTDLFLPPEEEFNDLFIPIIWSVFALKIVGNVLLILSRMRDSSLLVDWDDAPKEDIPSSSWRRVMVANQWNRILTIRAYNVPFTLLGVVMCLQGLHWRLLACPIPELSLVDVGCEYFILRLELISYVWFVLIVVQWIWFEFIYWNFMGDPFLRFVNSCVSSNVSWLMRLSDFHGYYIHGRTTNLGATDPDEDTDKRKSRKDGTTRASLVESEFRVFETFFEKEMTIELQNHVDNMLIQAGAPSVVSARQHLAGDMPRAAHRTYKGVNTFLWRFFDRDSDFLYVIQEESLIQQALGLAPTVIEDSIFSVIRPAGFKNGLLYGLGWRLQLLYLVIFIALEDATDSPCVTAAVIFVLDRIIVKVFETMGRANLSKKSFLDDRLVL
jgi:meckelin